MRILGIDPGLSTTGIGLIEVINGQSPVALEWLTIETELALPLADRLKELSGDLRSFIKETKPDNAVVEKIFFATNKRTAIDTAHARGVIILALAEAAIEVTEITPLQLKSAITGDGKADKKQMQAMVQRTLKLSAPPTPADAADALALALYGAFTARFHANSMMSSNNR